MSWEDCTETVRAAAGGRLSDDQVTQIFEDVQIRADRMRRERVDLSEAEILRRAADEEANERVMAARIELRNRKMNALKRVRRDGFYAAAPDPVLGVEAKLVGINTPIQGGRLSVDAQAKALHRTLIEGVTAELDREGLFKVTRDGTYDRAVAREMAELSSESGSPGISGNRHAQRIAEIIHKYQDLARQGLNREGAWIGQYEGWIARTAHDADRIRRTGFAEWRKVALENLDHDRTFAGIEDREKFLKGVYDGLVSGVHLTPDGLQGFKDPAFTGPANKAKKLSQGRVLHWRDSEAWMNYQDRFGGRSLIENVMSGLSQAARTTALMREFGTNPRAEFDADLRRLQEQWRDRDPTMAAHIRESGKMLANRFDELDGTAAMPVNRMLARMGSVIRTQQSLSKLGGVVLSAITDVPLKAAELRYQGIGLLQGYGDGVHALLRGRGAGEQRAIMDLLGAGMEGMTGNITSRFDFGGDTLPGTMSKLANTFFRMSGLTYWTDSQRAGAEYVMSRHLGSLIDHAHDALPKETQRILKMFDIGPQEWNALRGVEMAQAEGRAFVTPDAARKLSDDAVDGLIGAKLDDLRGAAMERLAGHVAGLERLEQRLDRLNAELAKDPITRSDAEAVWTKAERDTYARQLQSITKLTDHIIQHRDGQRSTNQVLKTMRLEVADLSRDQRRLAAKAVLDVDHILAKIPQDQAKRRETIAAIARVKDEMVRRLDEMSALPDRLEADIARARVEAREDLALKLYAYFADRGEYAVLNPGARERAMLRQGMRAGTPEGEAIRFITQFKAFPAAMISKVWGREIHGGDTGITRAAGIVHMMFSSMIFGYVAGVLKDLTKGRTPRDPLSAATLEAAFLQGGGAGIYGDFFLGKASRFGNSSAETAAGPSLTAAFDLINIWNGARAGDDKAAAMLRWGVSNTPFVNLFYTRVALDYLFLYQAQEAMNPGWLRRFEKRVKTDNNQTFILSPSHSTAPWLLAKGASE